MPEDDKTLDHRTRRMIYNYVTSHPGEPFQRIKRVLDINSSTLRYHLGHLEKNGKMNAVKEDGKRCYYPGYTRHEEDEPDLTCLSKSQARVLNAIKADPGITKKELARATNLEGKVVTKCIRALRDKRLIWKVRSGRFAGYEYITKDKLKDEMLRLLIDRFLNNELDKERFLVLKNELDKD